jgi:hypothetical protein
MWNKIHPIFYLRLASSPFWRSCPQLYVTCVCRGVGVGVVTITCTPIPPASPGHQLNSIIHSVLFRSSVVSKIHAFSWAKISLPF